jgi:uncharacterized membrane protein YidH (DUF202 family)
MTSPEINAPRRLQLAGERTQLAWWRTGLGAFAVGIGVGRGIPALDPTATAWPYISLGVAFVLYGLALIAFGNQRVDRIGRAIESGESTAAGRISTRLLGNVGVLLGVATVVAILFAD